MESPDCKELSILTAVVGAIQGDDDRTALLEKEKDDSAIPPKNDEQLLFQEVLDKSGTSGGSSHVATGRKSYNAEQQNQHHFVHGDYYLPQLATSVKTKMASGDKGTAILILLLFAVTFATSIVLILYAPRSNSNGHNMILLFLICGFIGVSLGLLYVCCH